MIVHLPIVMMANAFARRHFRHRAEVRYCERMPAATSARALRTPWQLFFGSLTPASTAYFLNFIAQAFLFITSTRVDRTGTDKKTYESLSVGLRGDPEFVAYTSATISA
jgi:hypothetical protein